MDHNKNALHENVKHGDIGFPMKVYQNDFTKYAGQKIQWHWHEELEFVVVTSGEVQFSIASDSFLLHEGEGILINANVLHRMIPVGIRPAYMFTIVASSSILGIEKGFLLTSKYVDPFINNRNLLYEVFSQDSEWQSELVRQLNQIYDLYEQGRFGYEYRIHNILCGIWFELIERRWRYQSIVKKPKDIDEERIYEAIEFIRKNYQSKISLEEICREINVSKSECCRCFQRKLKMSPFEYLLTYRITAAAKLLETSNLTVVEIALQTGFSSNSYFCKLFRKYMSQTPLEYRENRKGTG